jgi:hypothetical protein
MKNKLQAIVNEFNTLYPVGTAVMLDGIRVVVREPAELIQGCLPAAWFVGYPLAVSIQTQITPAPGTLYRLGCTNCDRSDCDFVEHLPADWSDIVEADPSESPSAWQTHLGLCPLCQADE